jgi:hypothetical protein
MTITSSIAGNPAQIVTSESHTMATGNTVYIYNFRMDDVQKITFSTVPDAGTWQLNYGTAQTTALAFDATALQIQTALNLLVPNPSVTVTGNYSTGFFVVFGTTLLNTTPLVVATGATTPTGTYTLLTGATAVTTTIANKTADYIGEINAINASSGYAITNISSDTFSIPVNLTFTGRGGYCIIANLQVSYSFRIRTYGTDAH